MPSRQLPFALPLGFGLLFAADQLALAALPLVAALVLGAGPGTVGALVAAQGAAWLLVALPAGALVDRWPRRRVLALAPLGAAAGFAAAAVAVGTAAPPGGIAALGALAFAGSGAAVLAALAAYAALPAFVERHRLPAANARLELARAVGTLAAPPLAGWCAGIGMPALALGLAAALALGAAASGAAVRAPPSPPAPPTPLGRALAEGAGFALRDPFLRGIALCAVLFNLAFAAQLAALVPHALGPLGLGPERAGLAAGAYGAGLVLAALVAGPVSRRVPPGALLVFGPAVPAAAFALLLATAPPPATAAAFAALAAAQFGLGFGPVLWNVTRTALQQAVAPPAMLGRVGALMQVAVFGSRPLGALFGGWLAAEFGPAAAMGAAAAGFALSVGAVLGSPLPRLRAMPAA